jgi:excisionase family DNA binding protein
MALFNVLSQRTHGILTEHHISIQAAAEVTGYNRQYLRRLLRAGKLAGIKIGQVWLIRMASLETYLNRAEQTVDHRCGPKRTYDPECLQM